MHPSVRKTRSLSICLIMVLSAFGPIAAPVAADMPLTEPYFDLLMEENGTWEELEPGWMYDLEAGTYDMQIDYYNLDVGLNYTLRWITYGIHADGGGLEGNVTSEDVTDTWQMEVSEFDCWYQAVVEIINTTDGSWDHVYTQWYDFRGECTEYGTVTPSAEINGTWVSEPEELEPGSYNMSWDVTNLTAGEEYKLDYWYYLTRNTWDMSTSTNGYAWNATGSDESIGWNVTVTEFDCTLQPEALLWQNTTTGWTIIDQYWVGSWSEVIFLPCESMITAYIWLDEEGDWVELADQNDNEYWSHHFPDDGSCDEFWDNEGHWWECTDPDTGDVEVFDECYEFYDEQTGEDMLECYINYEPMYLEEGSYNITLEIVGLSVGEDYFLYGDLWESTYWGYESNHYELSFTAPTEEISNTVTLDINAETCSYGYDLSLDHNETSGHSEHLESMSVTVNGPCEQPPSPFTLTYDDVLWEPEWQYEEFDECEEEDGGYECWNNDSWGYQEDVPIAFLYDMSGPVSTYAPGFLSSAEIAIEHLNDNQDVYNFSLEEYDTACDGLAAETAAQDAVDDGIELVVGALCSGASMGANAILSSYGIPHISPTSSAPGLSDSSAYPGFFRVIVSDAMDGEALADLVRDSNSSSPAVLYHSDDAFLANVAEILIEDYEAGGGSICADLTVASGETDLSDEAQILTDDSCDSVVMVTYPETAGSMLTELDDDGWSGEMFTGEQVAYELENYMNDPSDADGLQFIERVGGPSDSERAEAFSEDCDNDSSCSAGAIFTYETYDAFSVLAESFLLASAWGMMLEDAIHAVGYGWDGASTVVTFNDDGDVGGNGYDLCDLEYDSSSGSLVSGCDGHWDSPDFYYNANEVIDVYDVINGVSWFEECDDSTGVWICQVWWMAPEIGAGDHDMTWNVTDLGADTQYKVEWNVQTHQNMGTWDYADEEFTFNATGNSQSQDVFELIDWSLETDNSTCGVSINVWLYENESDGSGNWWFSQVAADGFDFKGPCEQPPSPFTLYYDGVEHERVAHNMTGFEWCDEYYEGDGHSWFECYIDYDGDGNWDDIWGFDECSNLSTGWECVEWYEDPFLAAGNHSMTLDTGGLETGLNYSVAIQIDISTQQGGENEDGYEDFTASSDTYSTSGHIETDNFTCNLNIYVELYENESDGSGGWWHHHIAWDHFNFRGPCEQPPSPFTLYYDGMEYERVAHNMTGLDWCDEYEEGWFECYIDYDGDGNWDDVQGFDECSNLSTGWECVEWYEEPFVEGGNHSGWLDVEGLEADGSYVLEWYDERCTAQMGCDGMSGDWGGPFNASDLWDYDPASGIWTHEGYYFNTDNSTCHYSSQFTLYEVQWDDQGNWWYDQHVFSEYFGFRGPCEEPPSPFTLYYDGVEHERVAHNMTGFDWCDEYYEGDGHSWFECYIDYDGDGNWDDGWYFEECSNLSTGWECVGWYENPDLAAGNHSMTLDTGGLEAGQSYAVEIQAEIWDVMGSWDGDYSTELFNASSDMESLYFSMETDNSTCGAEVYVTLYEVEWDDYGNWWHDQHVFGDGFGFDTPCEQPPSPIHLLYPNETGDIVEWEPVTQINEYDVCYDYGDHFECWDNDDDDHRWENDCYEVAALDDSDSIWQCENAEGSPFIDAGYHGMTWNITDLDESDDYRLQSYIWTMGMLDYEMYEDTLNFTASSDSHDIDWDLYVDNSTCDVQISAQLMRAVDYDDDGVTDWYDYIASNYFGFMGPCVFEGFPVDVGLEVDDGGWQGVVGVPFEVLMNDDDSPDVIMQHLGYSLSAGSWDMKWTLDNLTVGEGYFAYYETDTPNDEGDGGGDVDWNTYDYCEWEGTEDDDDRWWCTYDGTDNDWEDWWFYCEYDEYDEQWWCTDDFGQSPDWEFSANGTEHMGGVDSSVEGFFEFNATSGSEEVIWTLDIEDETCVIAVFLELASNESDMEGFYVGIIAGPAAALDDNSNGVPDCMEEGGIGPDEGPEFEPEDFAVGIGYSAAFLDTDGDTATFYIEYYMVLDDEFRMKVDADFGDGDGFLNQSEADMFAMMATEGGDGEGPPFFCGDGSEIPFEWANDGMEDCADGSDEPQDFDGDGTTDNWFDCHDGSTVSMDRVNDGTQDCPDGEDEGLGGGPDGGDDGPEGMTLNGADPIGNASMGIIFVNLANGSGGSVEIHMGWELYYDVDADAEGEYALSYVGDDEDSDTFPFNTTFCAYTEDSSDEGYTIVSAVVNGTTVTEIDGSMVYDSHCLTMAPYEMLPPFTVTWGLLSSDSDGDGVNDDDDAFPWDPTETTDTDGDGWGDNSDVFPDDPDEWADTDGDGTGDNADTDFDGDGIDDDAEDSDGDGVYDDEDAFPDDANETTDTDGDGVGDNADDFPDDANETTDTDGDGIGDNSDDDADGDGQPNDLDDFPLNGQESSDADGDGVGDNEDVFPDDPAEWADFDSDEIGDNADLDDDNDGTPDTSDDFPLDANETTDTDDDGLGDNADAFPNDPYERFDSDGDGVGDNADDFPSDSSEWSDSDNDGTGDNADVFPNDPNEIVDSDGDGVGDGGDAFPYDSTETKDSDGDGVGDNAQAAQVEPEPEPPEEDDGLFGLPGFSAATSLASMLGAAILIAGRRKD